MNLMLKLGPWFTCLVVAVLGPPTAWAQEVTIRGRIEREVAEAQKPPVPYIRVTLSPMKAATDSRVAYTDSEGMYYFQKTKPGRYILKVWADPKEKKLLFEHEYEVVKKKPSDTYFDIKPTLIP
jgi:hypothetical protein